MLDIRFVRKEPDSIRASLAKRGDAAKLELFEKLIIDDELYRKKLQETEALRARRNAVTKQVADAMKAGDKKKAEEFKAEAANIPDAIKAAEMEMQVIQERAKYALTHLPNVLHDTVPVGEGAAGNIVVRTWGEAKAAHASLKPHGEFAEENGWADFNRAAKATGAGFVYLLGDLTRLDFAMQLFALDCLEKKGFTPVQVPLLLDKKPYEAVTDLSDFENVMYKIDGEDKYLIATSEHALGAMFASETFDPDDLPVKLAGVSPCFRREIGSHGVDTRGLFRMHQFNKVEQFVFSRPDQSWKIHEELIANAEEFFQALRLPYRIVNLCTGDMGTVAAKKYDLEVWMPREGAYREAVSCSNCTDYQAVGLAVRYRLKKGGEEKEYAHTLNSTQVATSRAMRAVLENFQTEDGTVVVPNCLRKYMNDVEFLRPVKRPATT
jgi:seryl-tRNA synthetase